MTPGKDQNHIRGYTHYNNFIIYIWLKFGLLRSIYVLSKNIIYVLSKNIKNIFFFLLKFSFFTAETNLYILHDVNDEHEDAPCFLHYL